MTKIFPHAGYVGLLLCITKILLRLEAFSYPLHTPEGLSPAGFSGAWCGVSFTWSFSHTHHKDGDFSSVWPPGGDEGADLSEAFATDNILISCKCGFSGEQSEWCMLGFLIVKAMIQPLPGVGHEPEINPFLHSLHTQGLSWVCAPSSALTRTFPHSLHWQCFSLTHVF